MSTLPTGTVTFFFTDIEGSTRLVQELGERFGAALEQHHAILRSAIADARGTEVSTEGDAFFAAFPAARDAVAAAVAVERGLAAAEWPGGVQVRVRIGLHTGQAELGGDNYIGLDVHRAARISAAAHGGQVLLSDSTRGLIQDGLPGDIRLRDLGRHRLRGLEAPERLSQLVVDGLQSDFPALRGAEVPPTNLVLSPTPLIGRARELAELGELLERARLITLTGPGGTGKTRLALECGRTALAQLPDGVFLVPLETFTDASLAAGAVAQALVVRVPPGATPEEALAGHLVDRDLLLILDNFEQVTSAGPLVGRLLAGAPFLHVIATSRVPLHLGGEQEYPVGPLDVPRADGVETVAALARVDAVALFVERARLIRPDFELNDRNVASVAAICRRLDGLPLAIELAAARLKILSPDAMLARLEHALPLLSGTNADVPARQRTLRGAIEWSHQLLEPADRALFRRLSVFSGGWTVEAAERVADPDGDQGIDMLEGLAGLVDQSLVRAGAGQDAEEPRFEMLLLIREFANAQLAASDEAATIARRHAEWVLSLVEAAAGPLESGTGPVWLDTLSLEHDNIRAALGWALANDEREVGLRIASDTWRFWQQRGYTSEGLSWFARLLPGTQEAGVSDPRVLAAAHTAAGGLAYWQNDLDATDRHYRAALELDQRFEHSDRIGSDLYNLAFADMARGDNAAALKLFADAADAFTAAGQTARLADTTSARGALELRLGNLTQAREWMERGRRLQLEVGNRPRAVDNATVLSQIYMRDGDIPAARRMLLEADEDTHDMGDVARLPLILEVAAALLLREDRPHDALLLADAAKRARVRLGGGPPIFFEDPKQVYDRASAAVEGSSGRAAVEATLAESERLDHAKLMALVGPSNDPPAGVA